MHRLTRLEYNNTVRDLLGVASEPADGFVDGAAVGELLAEQMMQAAETLATEADVDALLPCAARDAACADAFIREFGARAYRRPLDDETAALLSDVFAAGVDFDDGIRLVIETMLQSPRFLYRVEPASFGDGIAELDDFALASRLSYFLWRSMPDVALFAAAHAGSLRGDEALAAQVERMLVDPRAASAIADFHAQLLGLEALESIARDAALHPDFDDDIALAMRDEAIAFVSHTVLQQDGRLETLLTAPHQPPDPALAAYYGPAGLGERRGMLALGGVMTVLGKYDTTHPVARGLFVRSELLCQPMPPPPDVDFEPPSYDPNATVQEQLALHRENPSCASCHAMIDPIGFGFEHFDGTGKYRQQIDARGEIVGSDDADGAFVGTTELSELLAASRQVHDCMAARWFAFAFGRDGDACELAPLQEAFGAEGPQRGDVKALLAAIAMSDSFRFTQEVAP